MASIAIQDFAGSQIQKTIFDALADSLPSTKFSVSRWRQPMKNLVGPKDYIVMWNGRYRWVPAVEKAHSKSQFLYAELGWLDRKNTFTIDHCGSNGLISWAEEPLEDCEGPLITVSEGPLLVALNCDNMFPYEAGKLSPYFSNQNDLISHLYSNSAVPLRIRPHPGPNNTEKARKYIAGKKIDFSDPNEISFEDDCRRSCAVASIHSSCGILAMNLGIPVLSFGRSVCRHEGACFLCTGDPKQTREITERLVRKEPCLNLNKIKMVLDRVRNRQWHLADFPERFERLIEELKAQK